MEKSRIEHLPPQYRSAIEAVQPFQRGETEEALHSDLLLMLRDLDNQDKHRLQVFAKIEPSEVQHSFAARFESEEAARASIPPNVEIFAAPLTDGARLLRQRTTGRIASVVGSINLSAQVQVTFQSGRREGVTTLLAALCQYTRQVLEYVGNAGPAPDVVTTGGGGR
jgi:hypothetical protein